MIHVNVHTIINRPVEDVFAFIANFENHSQWEMNFEAVKLLTSTATRDPCCIQSFDKAPCPIIGRHIAKDRIFCGRISFTSCEIPIPSIDSTQRIANRIAAQLFS